MKEERHFVQVYTGNGKGKTTAALGLAVRAAGAGKKTAIIQWMKAGFHYSEYHALEALEKWIAFHRFGDDEFVLRKRDPNEAEIECAREGVAMAKSIMNGGDVELVILDEICVACHFGLLSASEILDLIDARPDHVELVLTGRYCPESVIARADMVTEMREVRHYFSKGVLSRKGFDC